MATEDPRVERLLDELLDSHLTPEQVCAESPELLPMVRKRWRKLKRLGVDLDSLFPVQGDRQEPGPELPKIPGYEVEAMLGRGGMGIIYQVRHVKLNRAVALKMLLSGKYAGAAELARFTREAQAIAALQHPNIVQIYDVGEVDGRAYFTMELVGGGSLSQNLAGTPQPVQYCSSVTETLASAIHAAHLAGIVHRDLKPANILLTPDGTPKISDFGLARYFEGEADVTLDAARVGTPSYMAPEQVLGKPGTVGPSADVYALGATLYELLVGRPPFRGETPSETEQQLLTQEPVSPSRLNAKVPRDLETICLKCLHKDPARRYQSAAELAEDLHRFLANKPIAARPTGMIERVGKWVRRRPALAFTAFGSIAIGAAGIAGAFWFVADRAATIRAAQVDLRDVSEAEKRMDWVAATTALDRARLRMHYHAIQSLTEKLDDDKRDLEFGQRLESIGLNRISPVENLLSRLLDKSQADAAYLAEFRSSGMGSVGDDPTAVAARIDKSNVRPALIAALDDWAICATDANRQKWLFEVARAADPDPTGWRDRARDPSLSHSQIALKQLANSNATLEQPVRLLAALGERLQDAGAGLEAIAFLRRVQEAYPSDFWANFTLADTLRLSSNYEESVRYYQAAIALRPQSTVAIGNLGMALAAHNRLDEAVDQFRKEIRIDPQSSHAHYSLGLVLRRMGHVGEAVSELAESVRLESDNANHQYNLALALVDKGQLDKAIDYFHAAIALETSNSDVHYNLGLALRRMGRVDEAVTELAESVRLKPARADYQYNLALALVDEGKSDKAVNHFQASLKVDPNNAGAHYNLGVVMLAEGKNADAMEQFLQTIKLQPNNSHSHYNLGLVLRQMGRVHESVAELSESVRLEPASANHQYNLALALVDEGQSDKAIDHFLASLKGDPNNAGAHYNFGVVMLTKGKNAEAIEQFRQTIKLQPDNSDAHYNLGLLLRQTGRVDGAVAELAESVRLEPASADHQYNLARALVDKGQSDKAADHFRASLKSDPNNADAHYNLGVLMMTEGQNDEAIEQFLQTIKLQPKNSHAHYNLGLVLKGAGKMDAAIEHLQKATELDPSDAYAHYNLGLGLMASGKGSNAIAQFEAAVKSDPKLADAEFNLGLALMASGQLNEAIYHFRRTILLSPSHGYAYGGLGNALMGEGHLADAQTALERCLDLLPRNDPWRQQYVDQLKRCRAMLGRTPAQPTSAPTTNP